MDCRQGEYTITDNIDLMDFEVVTCIFNDSYWAKNRPADRMVYESFDFDRHESMIKPS